MNRKQLTRREFLRLTGMTGGAAVLAACGAVPATPAGTAATAAPAAANVPTTAPAAVEAATGAPAAASGGDAVQLDILAENWGDIYNKLMTEIGNKYIKEHPSVTVNWNFDPDWQTKLTTLLAANTPPTATFMRPGALANLARKKTLMELDSLVQQAGLKREDFVSSIYDSSTYNGKLYAIPGGADYICMYYSKDVYKEVGLDPEKPPTTIDELLAHSRKILKKNANGDIERVGYIPGSGHFVNWAFIQGGQFYDEANQKITANHPANVEALTWLAEYMKDLDVNKLAAFNQRPGAYEAGNAFSTKQSAYLFDGFWTYEALDEHSKDIDYGVAFWPTTDGSEDSRKRYAISGWMYSIPQASSNPQAAWDFLRYAFIDKSAEMGYLTLNGPCVVSQFDAWEAGLKEKMGSENRMIPYLSYFSKTGSAASNFFPIIPVQSYYTDELNRVFDLVMRGEMTPQAGLDEVTKNVQGELDKAMQG